MGKSKKMASKDTRHQIYALVTKIAGRELTDTEQHDLAALVHEAIDFQTDNFRTEVSRLTEALKVRNKNKRLKYENKLTKSVEKKD